MSDFNELAERYIAAWNETDPSARRAHPARSAADPNTTDLSRV